eukprot:2303683-Amphidinium_carterae.1
MCDRNKDDENFKKLLHEARAVKAGRKPVPVKTETVDAETKVTMFLDKTFRVASEKQMKRWTGLSRIPKMHLKGLAKVSLPTEDHDIDENYYCFKDEEEGLQKLTVRVEVGASLKTAHLPKEFFLFPGQGKEMEQHVLKEVGQESGMASLLDKEVYLPSYEEFCEKKLSKKTEGNEGDPETTLVENVFEADAEYSGAAAASIHVNRLAKKPQQVTPAKVQKVSTASSED